MPISKPFSALSKEDVGDAGGKGASLGEMTQAGIPVPPGFVVLASTFDRFLEETELNTEIDATLHTVNHQEIHTVEQASAKIQALIKSVAMPQDIAEDIRVQFKALGAEHVAVRSSATAEDSASAAWAGQLDSFLNTTEETLLQNVQNCWASLFTPRAIFYRFEKDLHSQRISVAVVVQKMVASDASGIAFSVHPVTEDYNQLIIEAGFGLGEAIVSGQVTPDSYVVEKNPRRIIDINVSHQTRALYRSTHGGNEWRDLSPALGESQVLTEPQIQELSNLILRIEQHYGFPCDIEWAMEDGIFYIVQSRPITTLKPLEEIPEAIPRLDLFGTRDFTLATMQIATEVESGPQPWMDGQSLSEPYFVTVGRLGAQQLFLDKKQTLKQGEEVNHRIEQDASYIEWLLKYANEAYDAVEQIVQKESALTQKELASFIEALRIVWSWYTGVWWGIENLEHQPTKKDIVERLMTFRRRGEKMIPGADAVLRNSIAQFTGVPVQYRDLLTVEECTTGHAPSAQTLQERAQGYLITPQGVFTGEAMKEMQKRIQLVIPTADPSATECRGVSAYPGVARGYVRIVRNRQDANTVKEGEILVASTTTPDFIVGMKRAAAIISDEGGIVSHAAIASRELKKPCIIGTNIATQILHNGDEVEVDANNGVVRIFKKAAGNEAFSQEAPLYRQGGKIGFHQISYPLTSFEGVKKYLSIGYGNWCVYYKEKHVTNLFDLAGMKQVADAFFERTKNGFPPEWETEWKRLKQALFEASHEIWRADLKTLTNEELWERFQTVLKKDQEMWGISLFLDSFDPGFDQEEIHRIVQQHGFSAQEAADLLMPQEQSYVTELEQALADLNAGKKSAEAFLNEFFWIGTDYETFQEIDEQWLREKAKDVHVHPFVSPTKKQQKILKKHGLKENPLEIFQTLAIWRDDRKRFNYVGLYGCTRLVCEGLARQGIDRALLNDLTLDEVKDVFLGSIDAEMLKRREREGIIAIYHENNISYLEGDKATELFERLCKRLPRTDVDEIKGAVACQGYVKGIARIVPSPDSPAAKRLQRGDILITMMTRPEFVPLMRKAGGIITDEGGISSHAAIVSRELNVPCIIGAKIATQAIKDGDEVELDANNGVVRILKRTEADKKAVFKKSYSRDTTLFMQVLWVKSLTEQIKSTLGWENPFPPMLTHYVHQGVVEIWEHEKAFNWFQEKLLSANANPAFLEELARAYKAPLVRLAQLRSKGPLTDVVDIKEYTDLIYDAIFKLTLFFYSGLDDRSPDAAKAISVQSRKDTDFFAENDLFVRKMIAHLGGISEELAGVVLPHELNALPSEEELKQRLQAFVMIDGTEHYRGTLEAFGQSHPEYTYKETAISTSDTITGQVAYKGIVRGRVQIVKKQSDMVHVQEGDVLVAPMTTPDFLSAMKRASAFVTDEGGVICHAAIVAREMKKPCIIGTKIATQALHDGDEVEVDADNGVVRILNRAQNAESKNRTYTRINQDVDTSVLTLENVWRGVRDTRIKEQIGLSEPDAFLEVVNGSVINYYTEEEPSRTLIQTCADAVLTNRPLLDELKEKTITHSNEIWAYANEVREQIEVCPVSNYPAILARAYEIQADCTRFGMVVAFADVFGAVTERLMSVFAQRKNLPHPASYYATVLGAPEALSHTEQAYADIRQSSASSAELQKKYFWLDQGYIGTGLTDEQIAHIRESVAPSPKAPHAALQKELALTEQEAQLFRTVRDIIFIKTIRTEARQALFVIVNRMLKRLAAEYNVPVRLLGTLTAQELIAVIEGAASLPTNLEERWKHAVIIKNGDGCAVITGSEADAYVKTRVIPPKTENNGELKGQVAQSGTARGTVKLVFGPQHNGKVEEGDILISTATSPQLLPAMKKAAAFITDVGGITSHAAIVARELKKPCIVGTKIATQVLQDGDEVEVDANNGIVRILSRQSEQKLLAQKFIDELGGDKIYPPLHNYSLFIFGSRYNTEKYYSPVFHCGVNYGLINIRHHGQTQTLIPEKTFPCYAIEGFETFLKDPSSLERRLEQFHKNFPTVDALYETYRCPYIKNQPESALVATIQHAFDQFWETNAWSHFSLFFDIDLCWNVVQSANLNISRQDIETIWQRATEMVAESFDRAQKRDLLCRIIAKEPEETLLESCQYFWTSYRNVYALEQVREELQKTYGAFLHDIEHARAELAYMDHEQAEKKDAFNRWIRTLSAEQALIVRYCQTVMQTRDERKNHFAKGITVAWRIAERLFQEAGVDRKLIENILPCQELIQGSSYVASIKDELLKREEEYVVYVPYSGPIEISYDRVEENAKLIHEAFVGETEKGTNEIHGSIGNKGYARGSVRVIKSLDQFSSFQFGEILVTGMTRPEYVPLMREAAAIVTDEGGITCHAAIVSRELNKPCIIGTRTATHTLQDGDEVEVDANNGIVRILKRHTPDAPSFRKEDYVYMGQWKGPTLAWSPWFQWGEGETLKAFGIQVTGEVLTFDGHGFFDAKSSHAIKALTKEKLKINDISFFQEYVARSEKALNHFTELIDRLERFTDEEPVALFREFFNRYHQITGSWAGIFYIGDVGQDFITETARKHGYALEELSGHMHPDRKTFSMEQKQELLSFREDLENHGYKHMDDAALGRLQANDPALYQRLQQLVDTYAWVGTHHFWGTPYTAQRLIEDINTVTDAPIHKASISDAPDLHFALEVARLFAWLRLQTAETVNRVSYAARPLFSHLSKKLGISYEDFIWLTHQEIIEWCQQGIKANAAEIEKRKVGHGAFMHQGRIVVVTGAELQAFVDQFIPKQETAITTFKGSIANKGRVAGIVRVMFMPNEMEAFQEGEILVAPETTPAYVPIMQKAAAFVTDSGGITSHAAIVSREMKKPCIIGTKIATQVLHNGDEVEVDANTGIIKILHRASTEYPSSTPVSIPAGKNVFRWGPVPGRVFFVSEFITECGEMLEKRFGYPWPEWLMLFHEKRMVWINDFPSLQKEAVRVFQTQMLDEPFRAGLYAEWKEAIAVLEKTQQRIDTLDITSLSDDAFLDLWTDYHQKMIAFWTPTIPPELGNYGADVLLETELAHVIPQEKERKEAMEVLLAPEEASFYQEEESELLKTQNISAHAKKYYWLKNSYGGVRVLDEEFFRERKKEIPQDFDDAAAARLKDVQKKKTACIKKFKLNKNIQHIAETAVKNIEWQDERKKYIFIGLHYKYLLLQEAARRTGNDADALLDLFWDEIPRVIREKQRVTLRSYGGFHGVHRVERFHEADAKHYWEIFAQEKFEALVDSFHGTIASPGKATGKVRILLDPEQATFQDGEILVAPMTSPEYVFAMKKSAAILTDTGGLTSHAAIVSRELKKPCLVGTKVATQALHDGDEVEVDANTGTVTILKRA
ncbi:MAG: Phosphoenolpyruvate synthase [Candidatus Parcubacteria bacterium]|jgi:phosphoenolpyruvate synthase/pyruvate phosphate dikinase